MTDKELFKLALDSLEANYLLVNGTETHGGLEQCLDGYYSSCFDTDPINKQTEEAITALKERLADHMREVQRLGQEIEQESECNPQDLCAGCRCKYAHVQPEQEPVAWVCEGFSSDEKHAIDYWQGDVDDLPIGTQLYTTPPQRKPLTYEQITTISNKGAEGGAEDSIYRFVRAIEAAHGIKEKI
jgi:hypothetical protein